MDRLSRAQSMTNIIICHYSHRYSIVPLQIVRNVVRVELKIYRRTIPPSGNVPFSFIGKHLAGDVEPHTLFKSITLIPVECCSVMCDLSVLSQKKSLTPSLPALQKHINQVGQKCQRPSTCHCGLLCSDWWSDGLMVISLRPYPPSPLSYICINLHTMSKITNENILKNESQYPFFKSFI